MVSARILSVVGFFVLLGIAALASAHRGAISKRTVVWGVCMQWAIGVVLLRWPAGRDGLAWVSGVVTQMLEMSYAGSSFVFGPLGESGGGSSGMGVVIAFQILPTIIFVACLFAILYYVGVMKVVVRGLAWVMMRTMGTSGVESLAVGASIFMGQTEAPLTVRPFLPRLTDSELFLVMVAGMASVSGAILGAYVRIGQVPIEQLLTAVAMTAPVSIVMAKVVVPETQAPQTAGNVAIELPQDGANVLDAAATGASEGMKLALNVGAVLIAFLALVGLVNGVLEGLVVAGEPLSLQRVMGWVCMPVAWLMGVPAAEAADVGAVLGTRTVVNELIAFEMLRGIELSARSQAIATFAVTGFANVSSIGILIGGLGSLVPTRKPDIARLGVRALLAATLANFASACVAGALIG